MRSSRRVPVSTSWLPAVRVSEAMGEESTERRTGGIVRRGVERQIDDRKLLERPEGAPEFLESDPWRVLRNQADFRAGLSDLVDRRACCPPSLSPPPSPALSPAT